MAGRVAAHDAVAEVSLQPRDPNAADGKCHDCRYQALCGGCRARAYAATGSFLAEEPFCSYRPDLDTTVRIAPHKAGVHAHA